jgi:RimJ/RimL family protein N-acetyltransferase
MSWLSPFELSGAHCALKPLAKEHLPGLAEAAREGDLWKIWYTNVPAPDAMGAEIERRLDLQAKGSMLPFTSFDAAGRIVGMTTCMNVDAVNKRVEIGSTWTAVRMQRSPFNTECKLLLLGHAFEQLGCIAVEFRTHFFNHQSRRAIERLGAKLDGVLRNHGRAANGTLRDTVVYSIIESEWPTVKTHLRWQLDKPRLA